MNPIPPRVKDLTGQKFGRWTVLGFSHVNKGNAYWACECACPNHTRKIVKGKEMVSGNSKSCGCARNEELSERRLVNLTGVRFGRLKVLCRAPNNHRGNAMWVCRCQCPSQNMVVVRGSHLTSGGTKSCKCLQREVLVQNRTNYNANNHFFKTLALKSALQNLTKQTT